MARKLPDEVIEKLIIKGMLVDDQYTATLTSVFHKDYFESEQVANTFNFITDHFKQYNQLPPKDIIIAHFNDDKVKSLFDEVDSIDYDVAKNYEHLFEETNQYLKEQAFKDALMKGVDLVEKKKNPLEYKHIIEDALAKDLKIDLGVNYFDTMNERLKRILSKTEERVPSFFPMFDEFISTGFPPYTLSVFLSRIHGGKTNTLVNMASRQVLNGYSPLIISLEMSEDALCQRLDSIYSNQDINRIYLDKSMTRNMISSLRDIKKTEGLGKLIVKEFPTGRGTVQDFETFIRELHYRGIYPNPIYVDYIQIVASMVKSGKRHEDIGEVSKDLRAMGWKYNIPIISVGQLNRSGMMIDFDEVDFTYVGEGLSISADGDFIAILGQSEDDILYESEIHGKVVKNRLGGRVGEMFKWYLDKKSLKMYDESELQLWIDDANKTGDSRKMKN